MQRQVVRGNRVPQDRLPPPASLQSRVRPTPPPPTDVLTSFSSSGAQGGVTSSSSSTQFTAAASQSEGWLWERLYLGMWMLFHLRGLNSVLMSVLVLVKKDTFFSQCKPFHYSTSIG